MQVGPDQKLWVTMGDASHGDWAQDPDRRNGKVLRVNRDGSVPADNPIWPGHSNPTIVYSIGHRNPQGITFQPGTGRPYAAEHGPDRDDEINWIRAGRNYGWPCVTGNNHPTGACGGTYTRPAWSSEGPDAGDLRLRLRQQRRLGHLEQGPVRVHAQGVRPSPPDPEPRRRGWACAPRSYNNRWGRLRAAVMAPGGRLFLTTSNGSNDKVIRITPN